MSPETLQALAALIQAQTTANMSTISAIIEIVKLFPAGPTREPAIEKLQELINRMQTVDTITAPLSEALREEAQNAARS
jgi:hypothetical protein